MPDLAVDATSTPCVSDAVLHLLAAGAVSADQAPALRDHIDDCPTCAATLLALVRVSAIAVGTLETIDAAGAGDSATLVATPGVDTTLPPGTRLGRFEVRDVLGSGNMGTVFAGWDPQLARPVAIKVLRAGRVDERHARRLLREAKAMAQVRHPNVVTVFEVGQDADVIFIAMEHIAGETLRVAMARRPPVAELLGWLQQIASALAAVHAAGLVHRDVKPDNIFLERSGHGHRVVVGDFGLAAGEDAVVSAARISSPGMGTRGAGTPAYMPPEQLDAMPVDARADVFAFAVTAWEALTGARPFDGRTAAALDEAIQRGPRSKLTVAGVPPTLARLIERSLSYDLRARPATMAEVAAALAPPPVVRSRWRTPIIVGSVVAAVAPIAVLVSLRMNGTAPAGAASVCDATQPARWLADRATWLERAQAVLTPSVQGQVARAMDARAQAWPVAAQAACAGDVFKRQAWTTCRAQLEAVERETLDAAVTMRWPDDRPLAAIVDGLEPPGACGSSEAGETALAMAGLASDERRTLATRGLARLVRADVFSQLDDLPRARAELERVAVDARASAPSLLDGELALARAEIDPPSTPEAQEAAIADAAAMAERGGRASLVARAWLALAERSAALRLPAGRVQQALTQADWAITRLADPPRLRVHWLSTAGSYAWTAGDRVGAKARFVDALARIGDDPLLRRERLLTIAKLASVGGDDRQAATVYGEFLADPDLMRAIVPGDRSVLLGSYAEALYRIGDIAKARTAIDAASAITTQLPVGDPERQTNDIIAASIVFDQGDIVGARRRLERALGEVRTAYGADHILVGEVLMRLTQVLQAQHETAASIGTAREAIRIFDATRGRHNEGSVMCRAQLAEALSVQGDVAAAAKAFAEVLVDADAVYGPEHPMAAQHLTPYADVLARLGRIGEAIAVLERAVAVFAKLEFDPEVTAEAQFALATLLPATARARAITLARSALALYATVEPRVAKAEGEITSWLGTALAPMPSAR